MRLFLLMGPALMSFFSWGSMWLKRQKELKPTNRQLKDWKKKGLI
jgi:hypothetical protein